MCGEGGSEIADAEAPSTVKGSTLWWRGPCRYLQTTVLTQRAVAVEIVLYKARHICM